MLMVETSRFLDIPKFVRIKSKLERFKGGDDEQFIIYVEKDVSRSRRWDHVLGAQLLYRCDEDCDECRKYFSVITRRGLVEQQERKAAEAA